MKLSLFITLLILPILAKAQYLEIKYATSPEETQTQQEFCFQVEESNSSEQCYALTDFPKTEINDQKTLKSFDWIEVSDFALKTTNVNSNKTEIIPFVVRVRYRPNELSLTGIESDESSNKTVYAFGLLYLNEFENSGGKRVEMNEYGSQQGLPNLAQGLSEQQDSFIFHHNNLMWLQNLLEPTIMSYLAGFSDDSPALILD